MEQNNSNTNGIIPLIPARGNFSFINDVWSREMLQTAFDAIESVPNGWEALLPEPVNGFMFSPRPEGSILRQIDRALHESYGGHSGSSYGCTMRNMQGIARLGWEDYVRFYLNRNEQTAQPAHPAHQAHQAHQAQPAHSNKPVITNEPVFSILDNEDTTQICPICLEYLVIEQSNVFVISDGLCVGSKTNPVKCGHKYHIGCILGWVDGIDKKNTCPLCRSEIKIIAPLTK